MRGTWTLAIVVAVATVASGHRWFQSGGVPEECPKTDPANTRIKLRHEWNCRKYYVCIGGNRFIKECPITMMSETHFDPWVQNCQSPERAGCITTNAVMWPHPTDCSSYMVTVGGRTINENCPPDLYYNDQLKKCVEPIRARCKYPILMPKNSYRRKYWKIENGKTTLEICPSGHEFNRIVRTCLPVSSATPKSPIEKCRGMADNTLIADRSSCEKYFHCLDEQTIGMTCLEGLHFHKTRGICVEPKEAGCKYKFLAPHHKNCSKYYEISANNKVERSCVNNGYHYSHDKKICVQPSKSSCQIPREPCDDRTDGTIIANRDSCSKYWRCYAGQSIPKECPDGQHLSKYGICINAKFSECVTSNHGDGSCTKYNEMTNDTITMKECSRGQHLSFVDGGCVPSNQAHCHSTLGPCHGIPDEAMMADPNDCTRYVYCKTKQFYHVDCPRGLHFHRYWQVCVEPDIAGCGYTSVVRRYKSNDEKSTRPKFEKYQIVCPDELHYSPKDKTCVSLETSLSQQSPGRCDGLTEGTRIDDPNDCAKFYVCHNGKFITEECPRGLHYEKIWKICAEPDLVRCNNTLFVPNYDDCTKFYRIKNDVKIEKTCPNGLYFSSTTNTCTSPAKSGCHQQRRRCDGLANGAFLAHKQSCGKYYECRDGKSIMKKCPVDFYVNVDSRKCVKPEEANCELPIYVIDDATCTKYREIIRSRVTIKQCRPGFEFSRKLKTCVLPWKSGCHEPREPCDDTLDDNVVTGQTGQRRCSRSVRRNVI